MKLDRYISLTFVVFFLLLSFAGPASASQDATATASPEQPQHECTTGEMRPLIKNVKGKKVLRERKGDREIIESLRLDPSTTARISQGGCAHYGVQIAFEITAQNALQPGTRVSTVLIMLKKLAPHVATSVVADMIRILEKRSRQVVKPEDVIHDADFEFVTITLSQEDVGKKRSINVEYSFAL